MHLVPDGLETMDANVSNSASGTFQCTSCLTVSRLYETFGANKSEFTRTMLQQLGTEGVREQFDPCFWSMLALQEIRTRADKGDTRVAITDARFEDEAWAFTGDGHSLHYMYCNREAAGKPFNPTVRWRMTHCWDDEHPEHGRGCLPVTRWHVNAGDRTEFDTAVVVRVVRSNLETGLTPDQATHASETSLEVIQEDVRFEASSTRELAAKGNAWAAERFGEAQ